MRSLILGATGLVGSSLVSECETHCRTHLGTSYRTPHPDHAHLDVRDSEALADLVAELEPEVVFLAAGVTDPTFAMAHPDECQDIVVGGAANAAAAVKRLGGRLVFFTPDLVLGECAWRPLVARTKTPHPATLSAQYAEAEEVVRAELPGRHVIVRTSCVFGPQDRPRGFASRVIARLAAGEALQSATDRLIQPTYSPDLATAAGELVARGYAGTFHVVGPERMTEFTFARLLAFVYRFDADLVTGAPAAELDDDARPLSPWLDRGKLRSVLGTSVVRFPADGLRTMRERTAEPAVRLRAA